MLVAPDPKALAAGLMLWVAAGASYGAACATHPSGSDVLLAGSPGDLDTSDMAFRSSHADGCSGLYQGNNSTAEVAAVALGLGTALDPLQPELKAEAAGTVASVLYDGINWKLSYTTSSDPNSWSLSYTAGPDVSKTYDVIAVVKQATGWAVFRFAEELFTTDGNGAGTFFIDWCKGSQNASFACSSDALSHMSIYLASSGVEIPAPASLPLMLIGLAGLGWRLRSR